MSADATTPARSVIAVAPGKVILFGEHAINRGQPAIAAAVGLYARCRASHSPDGLLHLRSKHHEQAVTPDEVREVCRLVDEARANERFDVIRDITARDFFAPQKYVLGAMSGDLRPPPLVIEWDSEVPPHSGLGSGGSAFTSMVAAVTALIHAPGDGIANVRTPDAHTPSPLPSPGGRGRMPLASLSASEVPAPNLPLPPGEGRGEGVPEPEVRPAGAPAPPKTRAGWAHLGDVVAHGGIASALDTQTSLLGGIIRFTGHGLATRLPFAADLTLVIGDTAVHAATAEVNARVRRWLDERPVARVHIFRTVGALTRAAETALSRGDWDELGRLMNLNQLVLEKIGVSCPEADRLIDAALEAGALGAKVSGSGGGGIVVALAMPDTKQAVTDAITSAGGKAFTPPIAVPGVTLEAGHPS